MGTQPRLPGTLPSPPEARKNHARAVHHERQIQDQIATLAEGMRDLRKELKKAQEARRRTEDDLDAIDEGRRPARQ